MQVDSYLKKIQTLVLKKVLFLVDCLLSSDVRTPHFSSVDFTMRVSFISWYEVGISQKRKAEGGFYFWII